MSPELADDCRDRPCALGAVCHDLVNDFECECPHGFGGKRCQVKQDLCQPDPCVHGDCLDRLFQRECVCRPGWTGPNCDQNVDECAAQPCRNGGLCRDKASASEDSRRQKLLPHKANRITVRLIAGHCAVNGDTLGDGTD